MKLTIFLVPLKRSYKITIALVASLSLSMSTFGQGINPALLIDSGLIPIERSRSDSNRIDDLFNPESTPLFPKNEIGKGGSIGVPRDRDNSQPPKNQFLRANVPESFRCNLFETVPHEEILSALNILNQAVNSPNCVDSKVNVQSIVENNRLIAEILKTLRGYKENPKTIPPEQAAEIVTKVDMAIRAFAAIANSFAQTDFLKEECRAAMGTGDVVVAVSDLLNGLTPYALMAATMTGGTSVIPYIVGGSVITGALSSMSKIVSENTVRIKDAQVRRAIVENTCQFIRLDQKYKFLIQSRQEQITRITEDLSASQRLFSANVEGLSKDTNGLLNRKNALDKIDLEVEEKINSVWSQLEMDKQFMTTNSDNIKICQLGIQLSLLAQDKSSYVATLLSTLDEAMTAYGTTNIAQAQALKFSSRIAMEQLQAVAASQFGGHVDFNQCAQTTKSFVETIEQSSSLAKRLIKLGKESIYRSLQGNQEYSVFKSRSLALNEKRDQAERVTQSLNNLQSEATALSQSEINSEIDRLRRALFHSSFIGSDSPVMKWFHHVRGLHNAGVSQFDEGLKVLRLQASRLLKTPNKPIAGYPILDNKDLKAVEKYREAIRNLEPFNLTALPLGTPEHEETCRELIDVWSRWIGAIDHLAAMDSFCSIIEPYIYDTRLEDRQLVKMCRGYRKARGSASKDQLSEVAQIKNELVVSGARESALFIRHKIESLVCLNRDQKIQ